MKIKKDLVEQVITEAEQPADQNLANASVKDIEKAVEQGAAEQGVSVNKDAAKKHSKDVFEAADLIENPYGTASINDAEETLQIALRAALRDRKAGINRTGAFPNVILYGLAGFGKTAVVKQFCIDHRINIFECDAKSLDTATIGGIPYPMQDPVTGRMKQTPVISNYWDTLSRPNTILFLDELNRTSGRLRGSLLTLINEHVLPGCTIDKDTGKVTGTTMEFPDILFTVVCINPANDVFDDAEKLDPAMVSRHPLIQPVNPDTADFLRYLTRIYDAIAANPHLDQDLKNEYAGQYAIAKAILTDPAFIKNGWDNEDEVRTIFLQSNKQGNYLNYRSFLANLVLCNGKKDDYLRVMKRASFQTSKENIIKNALANYKDIVTTGNNIFNKAGTDPKKAVKAAQEVDDALSSFIDTL